MGRRNKKQIKEAVKAILESKTQAEAYQKLHPECKPENAMKNSHRLMKNEDIVNELNRVLDMSKALSIDKELIVKIHSMIIMKWMRGEEKTADVIRVLENLQKLVPDFVDRKTISDYSKLSDSELDNELQSRLRELGVSNETNSKGENLS